MMKQWLIGEGIWDVVDPDKDPTPPTSSAANTPDTSTNGSLKDLESSIFTKNAGFGSDGRKLDAKSQFYILLCINEDDQELVAEEKTSRGMWNTLLKKYQNKLQTTGRQLIQELVNYKKSPDVSIEATYTDITKKSRKIASMQTDMAALATPKRRFQTLLQSLPAEYMTIRDAIDAQDNPDIDRSIQKLQEKEASLKAEKGETALVAYDRRDNRPAYRIPQRRSSSSDEDSHRPNRNQRRESERQESKRSRQRKTSSCFLCGKDDHRIKDCSLLKKLRRFLKRTEEKARIKKDKKVDKPKAYNAEVSSVNSDSSVDIDSDDEEDMEEIAALSKELVSKIPKSKWVADTGATSDMTDELRLFSGPLESIKRRTIKVGGGKLYSDQRGMAIMKAEDGECELKETLYVPDLGVNLLSARRLTKKGLKGSFDDNGLYMHTTDGTEVLRATAQGGVYIVDKISPQIDDIVPTSDTNELVEAISSALPAMTEHSEDDVESELTAPAPVESNSESTANEDTPSKKHELFTLWHRRLGHLGSAKLRGLHKVTTLKKPIPIVENHDPCETCALTKMTNRRNHRVSERKHWILASVSIDICGPLPTSRTGCEYFLEIIDNHSRRIWHLPIKSRADAPAALVKWRLDVELQSGCKLQAVRSDNAKELKVILDSWCNSIGIVPEYTVAYNSLQNGIAERGIRTSENQIRAMLHDAGLPIEFWPEAGEADAYVRNRVATGPIVDNKETSPMEAFTGVQPSIDHLRVWGCKCYSPVDRRSLPKGSRTDKLIDTGRPCIFLGYDENTTTQYRMWAPDRREVIKHHKVIFSENEKWGSESLNLPTITMNALPDRRSVGRPRKETPVAPVVAPIIETAIINDTPMADPIETSSNDLNTSADTPTIDPVVPHTNSTVSEDEENQDVTYNDKSENNELTAESSVQTRAKLAALTTPSPMVRRFLHVAIPKRKREDATDEEERDEHRDKIARAMMALLAQDLKDTETDEWALSAEAGNNANKQFIDKLVIPIPETYEEAINDPVWGKLWLEAIQNELTALIANGTWEVAVPPKDANIVTSKWVFKTKMHIDGTLDKLKARLVARGFSQMYGIDYTDTFAPTVKFDTLRLFLVIVALEDLECHQVDVNNAFTESFLKEVIYMRPPPGVNLSPGQALLIRRSLYGLKQAARDWHERCVEELRKLGFEQCPADPCMLRHKERGIILLLYVDDIPIAAKSKDQIQWFKNEFQKIFKIKDLGEMVKILGIRITRDRKKRTIRLDQTHYLSEVFDDLHMAADKHRSTQLPMSGYDALRPAGPEDERIDSHDYAHKIGKLMYAAIHTRPDISFPIGRLSQYLSDPAKHHGQALWTLLRYVRSTIDLGIVYGASGSFNNNESSMLLKAFSDSDYAADRLNRKSILGYVYMFAGGPIAWMSRKQKSVATSTTEAEYMALSTCAKEGLWLAQLLKDMGYAKYLGTELNQVSIAENVKHEDSSPIQLLGDNQAANLLVKDAHIHERSKHIDVAYHHIRDLHKRNLIQLNYIPSEDMVADGLTKPLSRDKFKRFVAQLGLQGSRVSGS